MQTFRKELTARFDRNVSECMTQQLLSSVEMWQWPQLGLGEGRAQWCSKQQKAMLGKGHRRLLREGHKCGNGCEFSPSLTGASGGCSCLVAPSLLSPLRSHISLHIVFPWVCPSPTQYYPG